MDRGMTRAPSAHEAEVVVLNSCTVTAAADQDVRSAIRRIHRNSPGTKILVTGCYAQRAPGEISALPGVTLVVGNSHKHEVADYVLPAPSAGAAGPLVQIGGGTNSNVIVGDVFAHTQLLSAPVFDGDDAGEKTRANLMVQDGCNNRCSFCIIP